MYGDFIRPALSYASLARDEAKYQEYLTEQSVEHEDFFDDKGVLIELGDFYIETAECILSGKSIDKLAENRDLASFLKYIYGEDMEVPDWAEEYYEQGDYSGLLDGIDRDSYKRYIA